MGKYRKSSFITGISLAGVVVGVSSPAYAQNADQTLQAQDQTIVVTGQKRETTVQESDIAVTVLDAETIRETRLRDVRRIDDLVPNVQFNESGQLSSVFVSIRGVESNPFIVNRAAIYIDGMPFRELSNAVLNQIQSIEVLRGPQSTLYGANSEAGLILITTRRPSDAFEGEIRATASTFNGDFGYGFDGFVGGGLTDNLKASLAFKISDEDAYVSNPASATGQFGEVRDVFLQGRVVWEPTPDLSVNATAYILDTNAPGLFEQEYAPIDRELYDATYAGFNNGLSVGRFEFLNDTPKRTEERSYVAGLSATYRLGYGKIDASFSYADENQDSRGLDLDLTALSTGAGADVEKENIWSGEMRFTSPDSETFEYLVGASWYREESAGALGTLLGPGDLDDFQFSPTQFSDGEDFAVFGSATLGLGINGLSATAGLRYDYAQRSTRQSAGVLDLGFTQLLFQDVELDDSFEALLPRFALSYKPSDQLHFYASAARGYIPGGFNLTAAQADVADDVIRFDKESVWSYEIGFKASSPDRRTYFNAAAFYIRSNNWQEVQVLFNDQGQVISSAFIASTASIESSGFELEAGYEPFDGLKLTGSFGYTDATYRDFQITATENLSGNRVKLVPEFDANLALRYETATGFFGRIELNAIGRTSLDERERAVRGAVGLVNLQAGYEGAQFSVRGFIENATNRRIETGLAFENFGFGSDGNFYAPLDAPRIFGVETEVRF
ncbi:TonB-dependent receptor [Parasphingorhabdus cellanae]|uniref:TonB-dependent receptor n=1 Tax=Parasphingorhabdus cellanae TaxID=2806553 RepID=A0ABX7T0G4_9SPHN|nr:TonB-dependent receptor [Parasphingorhabdus cellanae]QTD54453.1 TonB-dependent receptor [Parasphingorhabdus cellanae]